MPVWRGPRWGLETLYVKGCSLVVELMRTVVPEGPGRGFKALWRLTVKSQGQRKAVRKWREPCSPGCSPEC